mmetsp:Transcript_18164/g.28169  ORF Transcript_18164/g.28169 Transcript_18164/m.28169 type:complete len:88 (-) Transcript_18164:3150-3413(-)
MLLAFTVNAVVPHRPVNDAQQFILVGFSKGGVVLNQLLTEMAFQKHTAVTEGFALKKISHVHYVDVGLNNRGAYLTDPETLARKHTA